MNHDAFYFPSSCGAGERRLHLNSSILWEEPLRGSSTWSHVLKRGTALRLTAIEANPNVGAIFLNADNLSERLNIPDTMKAQHIAHLSKRAVLYSDMGRVLCSITEDTLGWHDLLGGCSDAALVTKKYGNRTYQSAKNDWYQNALDGFLIELAKYGLGPRDLMMNVNLFSKVQVLENGGMQFVSNYASTGSVVELRAEMNILVILNSCQHPMDPSPQYTQKPVMLTLKKVEAPALDDVCRTFCPENGRGFMLTERYFL
jgi:urea carboxylase-associated protein 2